MGRTEVIETAIAWRITNPRGEIWFSKVEDEIQNEIDQAAQNDMKIKSGTTMCYYLSSQITAESS